MSLPANKKTGLYGDVYVTKFSETSTSDLEGAGRRRQDEAGNGFIWLKNDSGVTLNAGEPLKYKSDSTVDKGAAADDGTKPYVYALVSVADQSFAWFQDRGILDQAAAATGILSGDNLTFDGTNRKLKKATLTTGTDSDAVSAKALANESGGLVKIQIY